MLGRSSLLAFTRATFQAYNFTPHLIQLAAHLSAVEEGRTRRLLVTMPPRHGKSELCAIRFPCWYLGRNPDKRVVLASYAADLAQRFSRHARGVVMSDRYARLFPGVSLAQDSRSTEAWDLAGHRGGMKAVGVGGPLTGHGANLLIIDDPIKNREEANSELVRQNVWDWYTSTAYTRLEDNGAIVVVMTRWHEDDLMARLLEAQSQPGGDQWTILHLPALSDSGEALWPEKFSLADLERIRANVGEYDWSALFQGRPTPKEGAFFKVGLIEIVDAIPAQARRGRGWDKGATAGGGDPTAGSKIAEHEGIWYIEDVVRGHWDTAERDRIIRQTAELDGPSCMIWGEQEPGSGGKDSAKGFTMLLSGFNVMVQPSTTNKQERADGFSAQVNAGNVKMLRAPWNRVVLEEMRQFPLGKHDDIVDGLSGIFNRMALRGRTFFSNQGATQ
jgi:predicted phage terminase large subunit-like protein